MRLKPSVLTSKLLVEPSPLRINFGPPSVECSYSNMDPDPPRKESNFIGVGSLSKCESLESLPLCVESGLLYMEQGLLALELDLPGKPWLPICLISPFLGLEHNLLGVRPEPKETVSNPSSKKFA